MNSEGVLSTGMTTSHGLGIQVSLDVNGELTSSYQGASSRTKLQEVPIASNAVHWAQVTQNPLQVESEAVDAPVLMTSEGFSPLFSMVVPPAMTGEKMVRKESFWSENLGSRSSTQPSRSTTTACLKAVCPRVQGMQKASLANIVHWSRAVGFATCCGPRGTLPSRWLKAGSRRLLRLVRRVPVDIKPHLRQVAPSCSSPPKKHHVPWRLCWLIWGRLRGQQRHGCPYRQSKQRRLFGHHELDPQGRKR